MSLTAQAAFFLVMNALVLPFWGAMLVAPKSAFTRRLLASVWICAPFALLYLVVFVTQLGALSQVLSQPSFEAITTLIGSPVGTNFAWLHYLTCDLFVGRWIYWDSQERAVSRPILSVVYLLGLTFCPLALLLYLAVRGQPLRAAAKAGHG